MRKKKKKVESLGKITALEQIKMGQTWQGNQRGMVHKDKSKHKRKKKYKETIEEVFAFFNLEDYYNEILRDNLYTGTVDKNYTFQVKSLFKSSFVYQKQES